MTEVVVAPLDAYATAKPDEPTFTLQGGDPLAGPLVRVWALLARRRAGIARFEEKSFSEIIEAAIGNSVSEEDREHKALLVRATAAEEVSWSMDAYLKGNHHLDQPSEVIDIHLTELQRIDLHALKISVCNRLSNFRCEVREMAQALGQSSFDEPDVFNKMVIAEQMLSDIRDAIEPRRLFRKES